MRKIVLLAGLGYGDEGKGTTVDFLTRDLGAKLVVRYNGGAQAAHNVVTPDGRHHTFSQFGSGTFAGAETFLSRYMLVNPIFALAEARHLTQLGITEPLGLLTVDREALITTPFHVAANRLREMSRGNGRHGSCGMGIGETMSDSLSYTNVLRAGDLFDRPTLRAKLRELQQRKCEEVRGLPFGDSPAAAREWSVLSDEAILNPILDQFATFSANIGLAGYGFLGDVLRGDGVTIFEGAQGVLLDQDVGFHPYTTWTDTTFQNADRLIEGYDGEVERLGIMRAYMTRHGAGPFVTEGSAYDELSANDHNRFGEWQQNFRSGALDYVALKYALDCLGGINGLVVTHMDRVQKMPEMMTCGGYYASAGTELDSSLFRHDRGVINGIIAQWDGHDRQERITKVLGKVGATCETVLTDTAPLLADIHRKLQVPVRLASWGQQAGDKKWCHQD